MLAAGGHTALGAYEVTLKSVAPAAGPNYDAERGEVVVTRAGRMVCEGSPERRFYPVGGETTSEVAICLKGLDDVYLVLGERRAGPNGQAAWLVRAYYNPLARLIFLGPLIMALGGLMSLSDRRLRFAATAKTAAKVEAAA